MNSGPMQGIMVTGHRPDKLGGYGPSETQAAVRTWLWERVKLHALYNEDPFAISGMALGVDQWFAEEALDLGVPVHAYVPFEGQESRWPEPSRYAYGKLLKRCAHFLIALR